MKKTSQLEFVISQSKKYKQLYVYYGIEDLKNKIQPALLQILIDFDKMCKKHSIYYVITAGTLLGAVREKGFIAWDDDIDVLVKPDAYGKIREAVKEKELSQEYDFISPDTSNEIALDAKFVSKKISLGTLMLDEKIGHPLYIDVLSIENVPNNFFLKSIKGILSNLFFLSYTSLRCLLKYDELLNVMAKDSKELWLNLMIRKMVAIPAIILGKHRTYKLLMKISSYADNVTKYVTVPLGVLHYKGEIQCREVFETSVPMEFENHTFPAPKGYLEYLNNRYGSDYMTPPPKSEQGIKCFQKRADWKEILKGKYYE